MKYADFIKSYREVFQQLAPFLDEKERTAQADFLVERMSHPDRFYHNMEHIQLVAHGLDPLGKVAAYYHDIIYLDIDGLHPQCHEWIKPYVDIEHKKAIWPKNKQDKGPMFHTFYLFEMKDQSPLDRCNEFLSAIFVASRFEHILSLEQITAINTAIYSTIPFKGRSRPMDSLAHRLGDLGYSSSVIKTMVHRAVALANQDIGNFGSFDFQEFAKNSQNLLLEEKTNKVEFDPKKEIEKMKKFLGQLHLDDLFYDYGGIPSQVQLKELKDRAKKNIQMFIQSM